MHQINRRRRLVLKHLSLALGGGLLTVACTSENNSNEQLLRKICDTIIPADAHPGALDLNYDSQLHEQIKRKPNSNNDLLGFAARIESLGVQRGGNKFSQQTRAERETTLLDILHNGAASDKRALQRIRSYLLRWYYGSEDGHKSLGYTSPSRYTVVRK